MRNLYSVLVILISSFFLVFPGRAEGATLYLSPSTGTYTVGNTFLVQVKVNSGGVPINASDGTLVFNADKLEVVSLSKSDSVFSLWVEDPVYSNSVGTISFAGGKPSPGYTGAAGTVISITFKAKIADAANLTFASGSVLADDGKGTNVLTSLGTGAYTLTAKSVPTIPSNGQTGTPAQPSASKKTPGLPVVSSLTHPDENKWYSNNDPQFSWEIPSDVTEVSFLLHKNPIGNPGPISNGKITTKSYEDIEDDTWYFHIKFRNSYGWGEILHRKVLIDTTPPTIFKVIVDKKGDLTNPSPVLYFESTDVPSGIEYYEVVIDREEKLIAQAETAAIADIARNPFQMSSLTPGTHIVEVKAFDKAENFSLTEATVEITPIEAPTEITEIPKRVDIGELLEIKGKTVPGITVRIYLQRGTEEPIIEKIQSDSSGNFLFTYDKALAQGSYQVWAQAEDEKGALGNSSEKYPLEVGLPAFLKFGKIAIDYLTTMLTLFVLIVGLIAIAFYAWYRISVWRKRVRKETEEVSQSVTASFRALRDEVEEQIALLDKKPGLTKGEKEIRDKLHEALDISEKFISKEIKDVDKELE